MSEKPLSVAEVFATLPEPTHESEYRRGYRDGFFMALWEMDGLMFGRGLSRKEAYEQCYRFWLIDLRKWAKTDIDNRLFWPPHIP